MPDMSEAVDFLHQDIGPCVWESESHQATTHQHRRCQEDWDDFTNTDQRAKDKVPQHCCQLTQGVTEAKASPSVSKKESKALTFALTEFWSTYKCHRSTVKQCRSHWCYVNSMWYQFILAHVSVL